MAIPPKRFLNMTLAEVAALFPEQKCTRCRGGIEEHSDDQYYISEKPVCSDCYFEVLGNFIEKHPLYYPPRARQLFCAAFS